MGREKSLSAVDLDAELSCAFHRFLPALLRANVDAGQYHNPNLNWLSHQWRNQEWLPTRRPASIVIAVCSRQITTSCRVVRSPGGETPVTRLRADPAKLNHYRCWLNPALLCDSPVSAKSIDEYHPACVCLGKPKGRQIPFIYIRLRNLSKSLARSDHRHP